MRSSEGGSETAEVKKKEAQKKRGKKGEVNEKKKVREHRTQDE